MMEAHCFKSDPCGDHLLDRLQAPPLQRRLPRMLNCSSSTTHLRLVLRRPLRMPQQQLAGNICACQILQGVEFLDTIILENAVHDEVCFEHLRKTLLESQSPMAEKVRHRPHDQAHALSLSVRDGNSCGDPSLLPISPFWCLKRYSASWKDLCVCHLLACK